MVDVLEEADTSEGKAIVEVLDYTPVLNQELDSGWQIITEKCFSYMITIFQICFLLSSIRVMIKILYPQPSLDPTLKKVKLLVKKMKFLFFSRCGRSSPSDAVGQKRKFGT